MRDLIVWVAGVCLLALVAPFANAELITIQIEGLVDTVEDDGDYLEDQIHVGDIITGWYTYDTDTPDTNPDETVGHYWHYASPAGISLSVSGLEFQSDSSNVEFLIGVGNNGSMGDDVYWLSSPSNNSLPNGTSVEGIVWQLEDNSGMVLSDDSLPELPPDLPLWSSGNTLRLDGERGGYMIYGHITSAVPEPCTILLLGLGVLSVIRKVR